MDWRTGLARIGGLAVRTARRTDQLFNAPPSRWVRHEGSGQVLVFVHGLLSEGHRAWSSRHANWLELAAGDPALNGWDILQAEWYSTVLSGDFDLRRSAEDLAHDLSDPVDGRPPALRAGNLCFVCHSMGGLVVRQALVQSLRLFEGLQVTQLSFGTPALGAPVATILAPLATRVGQSQALELKEESPRLQALHSDFLALVRSRPDQIRGQEFVESHLAVPRHRLHRWWEQHLPLPPPLVGIESQGGYFGPPVILPGTDHYTISRPDSTSHPSHRALVESLP